MLDAADQGILADISDELGMRGRGGELLCDLLLDVLGRYAAKQGRSAITAGAGLRLKSCLGGAFQTAAADQLLGPVRRLAIAPQALRQQAERLHARLTDPALDPPPPRPGIELDLALAASSFQRPMEGLAEALGGIAECEAAVRHARSRRDQELEHLAVFAHQVGRFYRAVNDLAGR